MILFLGGDSRTALPEFDALADAYARTAGPSSDRALESRRYAAHCRNLGQNTVALDRFRRLLDDVAAADSHVGELALVINGPEDERTREIADLLARLRLPTSP